MLKRLLVFAYGLFCAAVFFATTLNAVGFVGNLIVPSTIDGQPEGGLAAGLVVDLLLLLALLILSRAARSARRIGPTPRLTGRAVTCSRPWSRTARRRA